MIDDLPKNCVAVIADSKCQPILVLREPNQTAQNAAARMDISVVPTVAAAIDLLETDRPPIRSTGLVSRVLDKLRK